MRFLSPGASRDQAWHERGTVLSIGNPEGQWKGLGTPGGQAWRNAFGSGRFPGRLATINRVPGVVQCPILQHNGPPPALCLTPAFGELLAGFDLDALARQPDTIIGLDADLRLAFLNPAWFAFAEANGGRPAIARDWGLGRCVLDACPPVIREFYARALTNVLQEDKHWDHDYECSSPEVGRHMRLSAYPLRDRGGLLVVHALIVATPRDTGQFAGTTHRPGGLRRRKRHRAPMFALPEDQAHQRPAALGLGAGARHQSVGQHQSRPLRCLPRFLLSDTGRSPAFGLMCPLSAPASPAAAPRHRRRAAPRSRLPPGPASQPHRARPT